MVPIRSPASSVVAWLAHSAMPIGNAMPISSAAGRIATMLVIAIGPKYAYRLPVNHGPDAM